MESRKCDSLGSPALGCSPFGFGSDIFNPSERRIVSVDMKKTMKVRMNNPVMIIPDAMQALQVLGASARERGVPSRTPHVRYSGRNNRKEDVMFRVSCISWPFLAV